MEWSQHAKGIAEARLLSTRLKTGKLTIFITLFKKSSLSQACPSRCNQLWCVHMRGSLPGNVHQVKIGNLLLNHDDNSGSLPTCLSSTRPWCRPPWSTCSSTRPPATPQPTQPRSPLQSLIYSNPLFMLKSICHASFSVLVIKKVYP